MKINLQVEVSDEQRNIIARYLDDRETKRLVTRKEMRELVESVVVGLISGSQAHTTEPDPGAITTGRGTKKRTRKVLAQAKSDELLQEKLKSLPKERHFGYIRGWMRVKNGKSY